MRAIVVEVVVEGVEGLLWGGWWRSGNSESAAIVQTQEFGQLRPRFDSSELKLNLVIIS
eukprot:COSAG02_NODE_1_length_108762_cov_456.708287_5_plen_59_part_00